MNQDVVLYAIGDTEYVSQSKTSTQGNEEYGYVRQGLEDAALNYGAFYERASDKYEVEVPPPTGHWK